MVLQIASPFFHFSFGIKAVNALVKDKTPLDASFGKPSMMFFSFFLINQSVFSNVGFKLRLVFL
jgi:hypothetical protein